MADVQPKWKNESSKPPSWAAFLFSRFVRSLGDSERRGEELPAVDQCELTEQILPHKVDLMASHS
jgi:hypothetical protein